MAHNLEWNAQTRTYSFFEAGSAPRAWHELGQVKLDGLATAEEAIQLANLDFTVQKRPLYIRKPIDGEMIVVPEKYATVRTDTNHPLGIVGERYTPIQNRDAFKFFDSLVGEGEAMYETAGVLRDGQRIWILAKLPDYIRVKGDDLINKYLLLSNTHDGSEVVRAKLTPIRVVCNNTLSMALQGSEQEVRISHTASAETKLKEAHQLLKLSNDLYKQLESVFNQFQQRPISARGTKQYVDKLFPTPMNKFEITKQLQETREEVMELAYNGIGSEMSKGTLWGGYNAVTEYVDHKKKYRNGSEGKINSIIFGAGNLLKQRAFTLGVDILNSPDILLN